MKNEHTKSQKQTEAEDRALKERLGRLSEGLAKRRQKKAAEFVPVAKFGPDMARALSLGAEFIGAILLGGALGLGFDYLVNSRPLGLILFLLLGFAGGVLIVIRGATKLSSGSAETSVETQSQEADGR